ncbi:S8 family serine peptidase [bacterium]|nr:S8 family serine peptidase [bacterium]
MKKILILIFCLAFLFQNKLGEGGDIDTSSKKGLNYVEGEVIIKIKTKLKSQISINLVKETMICGISSLSNLNKKFKVYSMEKVFTDTPSVKISKAEEERLPDLSTIYLLKFPEEINVFEVIKTYQEDIHVEYAEPNYIHRIFEEIPNDSNYGQQWYLPKINAPAGWEVEKGRDTVLIAIIDSGVDTDHEDLKDKVVIKNGCNQISGENANDPNPIPNGLDDNNSGRADEGVTHGTHVAGIAAAMTNNNLGIAGVAWNCKVLPVKVLNDEGEGTAANIVNGIKFAADWVGDYTKTYATGVINLSLGGEYSSTYTDALSYAYGRNCVTVVAAGNGGSDGIGDELLKEGSGDQKVSPVCNDGDGENMVLGVAAVDANDSRATFSNYAQSATGYVEVCAPGTTIYSSLFYDGNNFKDKYSNMAGTSMATPIVSGLAALVISKGGNLTIKEVRNHIINNGVDLSSQNIGRRINVGGTIQAINLSPTIEITKLNNQEEKICNDTNYLITWTANDEKDDTTISIYFDLDNSGTNGTLIHQTTLKTNGLPNTQYSWTPSNSGISSGPYYLYAKIYDGVNPEVSNYTKYPLSIYESTSISGEIIKDLPGTTIVEIKENTFNQEVAIKIKAGINKAPTSTTPTSTINKANEKIKGCKNIILNSNLEDTTSEVLISNPNNNYSQMTFGEKAIEITIPYLPDGINENNLKLFYLNIASEEWKLVKKLTLFPLENKIVGEINRDNLEDPGSSNLIPTVYKAMGTSSIENIKGVISWPNPFFLNKNDYCYLDNLPNDPEIKVSIFNLAGEEVTTFNHSQGELLDGETRLRFKWSGRNSSGDLVAPGLYFYLVKSRYGTKAEKMVIVR